jgi:hypothetical protein
LRPILSCRKGNGSLDVDFFTEEMENIYGRVSGKVSPSIPVTSKHIHQLTALQKSYLQKIVHLLKSGYAFLNLTRRKKVINIFAKSFSFR